MHQNMTGVEVAKIIGLFFVSFVVFVILGAGRLFTPDPGV
jgi:hypothetical protein